MQHRIPVDQLGPAGEPMAQAVHSCVHCGFCLPTCPTYQVLGQEMDSPRGRIILMKQVLEGQIALEAAQPHIDRCLGCLACETACPSGVAYRNLISPFRDMHRKMRRRGVMERLRGWMVMHTLAYPARFRFAARVGGLAKPLSRFMPAALRSMLDLLPDDLPSRVMLNENYPAIGQRRGRVALLAGCAQQVLDPDINRATIDVLTRNGVDVLVPRAQVCCGSLAWHNGEGDMARRFARQNLDAFPDDVDAIVTNAAGCGSGMQEYALMLKGTEHEQRARSFSARVKDVASFLDRLGIQPPLALPRPMTIGYHDACHLGHGQQVRTPPRRLLGMIGNLKIAEIPDGEICCGSAGTYNIDQPEIAAELGRRKAASILSLDAEAVAAGNIGCMVQIAAHLCAKKSNVRVMHTMQVLSAAYAGTLHQTAETSHES